MNEDQDIRDFIKARRIELHMDQGTVAQKIGVSRSYISMIETGNRATPTHDTLYKLEGALQLEPGTLTCKAEWENTPPGVRILVLKQRQQIEDLELELRKVKHDYDQRINNRRETV